MSELANERKSFNNNSLNANSLNIKRKEYDT